MIDPVGGPCPGRTPVSVPRRDAWLLGGILAIALALRAWRLGSDLPDFVEEAIPLRRALEMGGWQDGAPALDPQFFNYPSLVIYLHLALVRLQLALSGVPAAADFWLHCQWDPSGPVLIGRAVSIMADLAAAVGAWRFARRLAPRTALVAALTVAVAGPMVRTGRLIQVDPVMAALAVWAGERLVAWRQEGGRGRLAAAVVLIGLAAGAKYQGGLLVVPLAWVLWSRHGRAGLRRWPLLAGAAFAVFLATTPYALLDPAAVWHDLRFETGHMAAGHLGSRDAFGAAFAVRALLAGLGAPLCLAALVGLVAPLWQRRRPTCDEATLLCALLPLAVAVGLARMAAERYLVPLIPLLGVAAALGCALVPLRGRAWAAPLLTVVLAAPALRDALPVVLAGSTHTQVLARQWLAAHATADEVIVSEPYCGALRSEIDDLPVRAHPAWARASAAAREAFLAWPRFRNVKLPLLVSGQVPFQTLDRTGRTVVLDVAPHATDLNASYYAPALLWDVTWVQVSGSIRHRHEAAPGRYPAQLAWYRLLDAHAERAAVFAGERGAEGATVTIYRLGPRFRQALAEGHLDLDPLWWTRAVSADFRRDFLACCAPPGARGGEAPYDPEGGVAVWVRALGDHFERLYVPFLMQFAQHHLETGSLASSRRALLPILLLRPDLEPPLVLMVAVAERQGDLDAAEHVLARSLRAREALGADLTLSQLLQADLRRRQGRLAEARELAGRVLADPRASEQRRERARTLLVEIGAQERP